MNWSLFFERKRKELAPAKAPDPFHEIRLGTQAQALLDSDAYRRSVETMRVKLHEAWESCAVEDVEGQRNLLLSLKLLEAMEKHIKDEADTGKLAKRQIDDEQRRRKVA